MKTAIPLLKENILQDATPTKKTKRNEIVSNLEEADKIYEKTAINFEPVPSQARWRTATVEIIRECFKEVKDLSYLIENGDTPDDALGYMTSIRRLLKGSVPPPQKKMVFLFLIQPN